MHVGTEGTTPGVEQGKELSISVEERSSPNPVGCGLTQMAHSLLHFGVPGWAPDLEAAGESNLHLKAVWFLSHCDRTCR